MTVHGGNSGVAAYDDPTCERARAMKRPGMPTADFAPVRFSTSELPERERLPMWREEFGRSVLRVDIEPLSDLPFCAEATLWAVPGLRTVECAGSDARLQRTPAMVAEADDSIGLVVNLGRRAMASQRGRDMVLGAGDAVPIHSNDTAVVTGMRHLGMLVPRAALASRVSDIDDATTRPIPHGTEALRLLISYVSLVKENFVLATPKLRRTTLSHIYDLMALALSPDRTAGEVGLSAIAAARLGLAVRHITEGFDEPDLTVAAVARRLHISPRYLQRLLETTGTSFTARVNELRLQRAFTLLTEAHGGGRRISDVALQVGFSDISHFNRLFRARFGDTPSGVRTETRKKH
jgi:AraC-like DNA-binding protein